MSNFVVTYDLKNTAPDPHGPLLALAGQHGWSRIINCTDSKPQRQLPNTTLQGQFNDVPAATAAFRALVAAVRSKTGRPVIVERVAFFQWATGAVFDLGEFKS